MTNAHISHRLYYPLLTQQSFISHNKLEKLLRFELGDYLIFVVAPLLSWFWNKRQWRRLSLGYTVLNLRGGVAHLLNFWMKALVDLLKGYNHVFCLWAFLLSLFLSSWDRVPPLAFPTLVGNSCLCILLLAYFFRFYFLFFPLFTRNFYVVGARMQFLIILWTHINCLTTKKGTHGRITGIIEKTVHIWK